MLKKKIKFAKETERSYDGDKKSFFESDESGLWAKPDGARKKVPPREEVEVSGLLFHYPVTKKEAYKGPTCRSCQFRYKHTYGKMFYCSQFKQKDTAYGDKKIKAGDPACTKYKKK
ncbi:MAG: hypothetical protein ACEPOW_13835 [Bacteroidales bacterium]